MGEISKFEHERDILALKHTGHFKLSIFKFQASINIVF